ncbi:ROK family protein [Paenibacillus glycinis]|uniref:ROK family protein n=1 Tax=Paenibacillus glycinis TaxID=2697035 RepID=A0ABW9XRU5_9BACL|nr:ROK family protein [Paenibacillus glycinis]NBD25380.1 ROK family protein [Paenibacillus glycinis]
MNTVTEPTFKNLILAFDVGGTQIKAAAVQNGRVLAGTIGHYDARSGESADAVIAHFGDIAADLAAKAGPDAGTIRGIGLAFPGPFDYPNGISLIRGLGKFESLYGLNVGALLTEAIRGDARLAPRLAADCRIVFENDAALFGLGEAGYGEARGAGRTVCLTLGTGLGSCFLEDGALIKQRADVPDNGWLYAAPYRDGIADDFLSRRGFLRLAAELGHDADGLDVRDFAEAAAGGDGAAKQLFAAFGKRMAAILAGPLLRFRPERIVLGGQISKSGSLFAPVFEAELAGAGLAADVRVSPDTLASTFKGIYDLSR